jgi:uncharacterized membrane protein
MAGQTSIVEQLNININRRISAILKDKYSIAIILLTILGLILRFYQISAKSLWLDEAVTYQISLQSISSIWNSIGTGEPNPPLFYWIEHFMLNFGHNELVLRFIPAIAGTLTIPLVFFVGRRLLNKYAGVIAAALLTVLPFHIFYSQNARAFSLLLLIVCVALIPYLQGMFSGSLRSWILFGIFSAVAFWLHFYVVIFVATLFFLALCLNLSKNRNFNKLKLLIASLTVFLAASLPLLFQFLYSIDLKLMEGAIGLQGFNFVGASFWEYLGPGVLEIIPFLFFFALGYHYFFKTDRWRFILISAALIIPFAISCLLSEVIPIYPRYIIFLLPIFLIVVAVSYKPLLDFKGPKLVYASVLILLSVSAVTLSSYYTSQSFQDWKDATPIVQNMTADQDIVVVVPGWMTLPFDYYYSHEEDHTTEYGASSITELDNILSLKGNSSIIILLTEDIHVQDPSKILAWINQNSTFYMNYTGISIYLIR